nr:hypothetical protein CFP56_54677 [Quercus suber]
MMDSDFIDKFQSITLAEDEGEVIKIGVSQRERMKNVPSVCWGGFSQHKLSTSVQPRVWGLPFDLLLEEVGKDIDNGLGVDLKAFSSDQARFIRVRVALPLDKPLHQGGVVASPEGDKVCIGFKYEHLVGLCYQCGRIGHDVKGCSVPRDRK